MNFQAAFYDPLFASAFAASAVLTIAAGNPPLTVTVIPKLKGVAVGPNIDVQTIEPAALIRRKELSSNKLCADDLDDAEIAFGGKCWRVKAHMAMPATVGEADGVEVLILEDADD